MKENMYYGADAEIFRRAEMLRNTMTQAEEILWNAIHINPWHLKFRRQHPVSCYIVDFYCDSIKLVIELDGNIHLKGEVKEIDNEREDGLRALGLTVLRFKNEEVLNDLDSVLRKIKKTVKILRDSPNSLNGPPPPLGDGGQILSSNEDNPHQHNGPNPPSGDGGQILSGNEDNPHQQNVPNPPSGDGGQNLSENQIKPLQHNGPTPPLEDRGQILSGNEDNPHQHNGPNPPLGDGGQKHSMDKLNLQEQRSITPGFEKRKDRQQLYVIKIGGNIIDDEQKLSSFLKDFASISDKKVLIHGGGKIATSMAQQLNIPQQLIDGRRITDAETLKVITMVYAGYINKNIVGLLQSNDCNAIGLCGADGNLIQAHKRIHPSIDYGYVGDVDGVNSDWLGKLLNEDVSPVIAPVTHDKKGQLLNTNADTIAQEIAKSMADKYAVTLIYSFEKKGVLRDPEDENSVIAEITLSSFTRLREKNIIHSGMIPKLHNAFTALEKGVKKVMIGKAEDLLQLISGSSGTSIIHE